MSEKKLLLSAAKGERLPQTPLWLMRQAGRYLPEYRAIRDVHKTIKMFKTPELAADITLQPLRRFGLDGAILYADILLIPDALSLGLSFAEGEGPVFARPVQSEEAVAHLEKASQKPDFVHECLGYVGETLKLIRADLPKGATLIGFAGAPWTVACYMIEGKGTHGEFPTARKMIHERPDLVHRILDVVTQITIDYLHMQVSCGAEIVQLFESWASSLSLEEYATFVEPRNRKILQALESRGTPTIHFLNNGSAIYPSARKVPCSVLGVDWRVDLASFAADPVWSRVALQGNLDPALLFCDTKTLLKAAEKVLKAGRNHPGGFVFNLGHGIRPGTPLENVGHLVSFVNAFRG